MDKYDEKASVMFRNSGCPDEHDCGYCSQMEAAIAAFGRKCAAEAYDHAAFYSDAANAKLFRGLAAALAAVGAPVNEKGGA